MKKTFKLKSLLLSMAVAGATTLAVAPATTQAGVSANVGGFTDYVFRGFNQSAEGTGQMALQGGLDYEHDSGLYVGIWGSTMDSEYEYDLYAGWGGSFGEVDLGVAYTAYNYTDEDTYGESAAFEEVNLSGAYGPVSVGVDVDVDDDVEDYIHYSVSLDASSIAEGVSLTYGVTTADDTDDAAYFDVGYSTTISGGVDLAADVIFSGSGADDETYVVIGLSKAFDLM